jgi:hypothetical protein
LSNSITTGRIAPLNLSLPPIRLGREDLEKVLDTAIRERSKDTAPARKEHCTSSVFNPTLNDLAQAPACNSAHPPQIRGKGDPRLMPSAQ